MWGKQDKKKVDMMSLTFLCLLETLFWCPAECQNQSRAKAFFAPFTQRFLNQLQSPTALIFLVRARTKPLLYLLFYTVAPEHT